MNLFYQPLIPEGVLHLDADESRHCVKVLRHKAGDTLYITDGKGYFYNAAITQADDRKCSFTIVDTQAAPVRNHFIHIAISPTKNADRIEWFIEKAVEFGVDKISLIDCENTERSYIKLERLEKVVVSAMKQSLKATLPIVEGLVTFSHLIAQQPANAAKFIAYVDQQNPDHLKAVAFKEGHYIVLIGPEGDFSPQELALAQQHAYQKVSLGKSRLRTETAGIAACHILNLINE